MKRTLLLLLALMFAVMTPSVALAQGEDENVAIQVGTVSSELDAEVDVPVLLGSCVGVDSVQFDLNYDSTALSVVSVTFGNLFTASEYNDSEPGRIRVACASALGLKEAGTLLTLRFRVLDVNGSAVTISSGIVTRVNADYQQSRAFVSIEDGGVTIGSASLPAAKGTPWIPATPTPSPSPTPSPTVVPTPEATPANDLPATLKHISPAAYIVAGALVLALILIVVSAATRRKRDASKSEDSRKSS